MSFVAGAGNVNVDLVFSGLPRLPEEGEELYARSFSVQMGGGTPGTLINLSRLGVPTCLQTLLGPDMFSDFARRAFAENGVSPVNLYHGDRIPLNISVAALTPGDRTFLSYSESGPVTDEMQEALASCGFETELRDLKGKAYAGSNIANSKVKETDSGDSAEVKGKFADGIPYSFEATPLSEDAATPALILNGVRKKFTGRGVNIVFYESTTDRVLDLATVALDADGTLKLFRPFENRHQ